MRGLGIINFAFVALLVCVTSVAAKTAHKETNPAAPYGEDKPVIMVAPEEPRFVIKLKSNPTTGYSWFLREYNAGLLEPVKHEFVPPADKKMMGVSGYELWTFRMKPAAFVVPQQTVVRFVYVRPWESADNSTQVVFRITSKSDDKGG